MIFKHSVSLTVDQFGNMFKLFLYRIVVSVVFYSLTYLILRYGLSFILSSAQLSALRGLIPEFFHTLVTSLNSGDTALLQEFQTKFHAATLDFASLLIANIGTIIGSVIGVAAMYILQRFTNGIAQFALGSLINDRMSTRAKTRFANAYFRNIGRAARYYVLYVPVSFVYDLLSLLACWFLFFFIPSLLPNWGVLSVLVAISLTMAAVICLQALKLTLIYSWMPAMIVDGKTLRTALRDSFKDMGKNFMRRFGGFAVACYIVVAVNVLFGIATAGSGLLITVPLSFVFFIVMQFVNYFETYGKKFYLADGKIWQGEEGTPEGTLENVPETANADTMSEEEASDASSSEETNDEN